MPEGPHKRRRVTGSRRLIALVIVVAAVESPLQNEHLLVTGAAVRIGLSVGRGTHHTQPKFPGARLERHRKRFPKTRGPDVTILRARTAAEGVVARHAAVRVRPPDFGREAGQVAIHPALHPQITDPPVKLPIRAKAQRSAVVIRSHRRQPFDDVRARAADAPHVRKSNHPLLTLPTRDKDINLMVPRKVRVETKAKHPAFAACVEPGKSRERRPAQHTTFDHAHPTVLLGHEKPTATHPAPTPCSLAPAIRL